MLSLNAPGSLCRARHGRHGNGSRDGFSLTELLVASAIGLMVMAAVASLLGVLGKGIAQSRALIELNSRIRNAAWQLRQDLHGVTTPMSYWVRPEANAGYFQVMEDGNPDATSTAGDTNDVLMFTTMSLAEPFTGRLEGVDRFESPIAEVVWFCLPSGQTFEEKPLFNLHRRQLLVSATPGAGPFITGPSSEGQRVTASIDRNTNDLSFRGQGTANSLGDLSKQTNRFWAVAGATQALQEPREGEDIILTDVLAFDVQTFDESTDAYVDASYTTTYEEGVPPPDIDPVRGIRIMVRCIEPSSRRIRQVTIVHTFMH